LTRREDLPADFLLLDSFSESAFGGRKTFDWETARAPPSLPFSPAASTPKRRAGRFLLKPFALDVSSGVETRGRKDGKKITHIINKVRSL
jgi:phosphoribosylanthranilate isomerase